MLQALVDDFLLRFLAVGMELDLVHYWDDACFKGEEAAQGGDREVRDACGGSGSGINKVNRGENLTDQLP